jgi:hypothetical protein
MCWASTSSSKIIGTKFLVTNLGFQGCFNTWLGANLSFCLSSISPFHTYQNWPNARYLRPIEYPWTFGALHTILDVIQEKSKVCNNLSTSTILFFPTVVYWNRIAIGALDNLSNVLDICSCLLGILLICSIVGHLHDQLDLVVASGRK